jgi:nucleotide-binding universal stress UspA family protein
MGCLFGGLYLVDNSFYSSTQILKPPLVKPPIILVPTDFSDSASNAADYAFHLAAELNASLLLFHAYHVPVPTAEMPILIASPMELEKDNLQSLQHLRNHLILKHGGQVAVECLTAAGFAAEEIVDAARNSRVDLIVMGILGSIPTSILPDLKVPLLVIPEKVSYKRPISLVFACDYSNRIGYHALEQLSAFAKPFLAHIYIVDVQTTGENHSDVVIKESAAVEESLKGISHSVHSLVCKDVVSGLIEFQMQYPAEVMVMIPHRHSFLSRLFISPHTRDMVFKSSIPVLTLQE